jgi:hypothetical protein
MSKKPTKLNLVQLPSRKTKCGVALMKAANELDTMVNICVLWEMADGSLARLSTFSSRELIAVLESQKVHAVITGE